MVLDCTRPWARVEEERGMKRLRPEGTEAVAPVLAEIFLVLLSVALVATLYVYLNGYIVHVTTDKPYAGFGPVDLAGGNATFVVAAASSTEFLDAYRVNLMVNGVAAKPRSLGDTMRFEVQGTTYWVSFLDIGGEGALNTGDRFTVTGEGVALPRGEYSLYLLWQDATGVQSVSWTVV